VTVALMKTTVRCAVEGATDEVILRRILLELGIPCAEFYGGRGKQHLVEHLERYNRSARRLPWIVLLDLDHSAACAPAYVRELVPNREGRLCLRIAVRAVEAWLLADAERLSVFLGIHPSLIPVNPDAEPDPKETLVNLARRSRRRDIREDMVPTAASGRKVGRAYLAYITKYVAEGPHGWRPRVASHYSPSLAHCITALESLKDSIRSESGCP
jgi:hypothetical protein